MKLSLVVSMWLDCPHSRPFLNDKANQIKDLAPAALSQRFAATASWSEIRENMPYAALTTRLLTNFK